MDTEHPAGPSNLNIANVLTVGRIAGVPAFGWLLLHDGGADASWRVWAWLGFALLMVTDRIDGDLARRYNLVTDFGKLADPIADKALTGMAFVGLSIVGVLWWWVTALVLVREWGITALRFFVKRHGVMPASQGGRIKTTTQALALALYILPFEIWGGPSEALRWLAHVVMALAVALTLATGVQYARDARRLWASALTGS